MRSWELGMNDVFLIKNIKPERDYENLQKVNFIINGMDDENRVRYVLDAIFQENSLSVDNVTVKYNGIQMEMEIKEIPTILKSLVTRDIDVYGIYVLYDNQ